MQIKVVGWFATAVPDWHVGDEFLSGDRTRERLVNIIPNEDLESGEFQGCSW